IVGGALCMPPWLVIAPAGHPVIRLDVRLLDHVELREPCEAVLKCGDLEAALHIADGPSAVRIVRECALLTSGVGRPARGRRHDSPEPHALTGAPSPLKCRCAECALALTMRRSARAWGRRRIAPLRSNDGAEFAHLLVDRTRFHRRAPTWPALAADSAESY